MRHWTASELPLLRIIIIIHMNQIKEKTRVYKVKVRNILITKIQQLDAPSLSFLYCYCYHYPHGDIKGDTKASLEIERDAGQFTPPTKQDLQAAAIVKRLNRGQTPAIGRFALCIYSNI